jgi:cysteine desulfuration protein SufE
MKTIDDKQNEIVQEFSIFDDWVDKYAYLIEIGTALPALPPQHKTTNNLIQGCQSRVWLHAEYHNNSIQFQAESDTVIVKGIIALLIRTLSGHSPEEILNANLYFIQQTGLQQHLSPTRSNGLASMIRQMKLYALSYQHTQQ